MANRRFRSSKFGKYCPGGRQCLLTKGFVKAVKGALAVVCLPCYLSEKY